MRFCTRQLFRDTSVGKVTACWLEDRSSSPE
jgi:hypothetical protein